MDSLPSEKELVLQFSQGDERAFRQLFDELMLPLCYFARQLTDDKEEAEDIAVRNHCLNFLKK